MNQEMMEWTYENILKILLLSQFGGPVGRSRLQVKGGVGGWVGGWGVGRGGWEGGVPLVDLKIKK